LKIRDEGEPGGVHLVTLRGEAIGDTGLIENLNGAGVQTAGDARNLADVSYSTAQLGSCRKAPVRYILIMGGKQVFYRDI
jgi:hypothetical protein